LVLAGACCIALGGLRYASLAAPETADAQPIAYEPRQAFDSSGGILARKCLER
jgi:hypothetical protein